jgi:predicted negative regulator of RcsB-dependent stress response
MVEIYDPNEQDEVVKKWLRDNGSAIVMGLVVAFGGLFGFKQWQVWEVNDKQQASAEFGVMADLLTDGQLDAAMSNYQTLQDDYAKSPYASLAALQMARARVEAQQPDLAISQYQFVVDNGYPKALSVVARVRLARLMLDQGQSEEALTLLNAEPDITGFESRFAEVKGDIHYSQGRTDEAIAAYLEALDTLEAGVGDRNTLVLKLESMGAEVPEDGNQS